MSLMDSIRTWFSMTSGFDPPTDAVQTRATGDSYLADFVARIQGARSQTWRIASTDEALGVPAIFSAVTLIANGMGSMSLKAFQRGRELPDEDRPRIIVRPNPFTTPRDFFRDTAYSMAVYGEAWWWVAARDFDDLPLSLIPVNPREIIVTEDDEDLRFPKIEWRGRKMPNRDMRQITYLHEPGALRGFGPLQKCGAAVSVAVEAQEFAANFYAEGGVPSIVVRSEASLGGDKDLTDEDSKSEAERFRDQWMSVPHNTPRIVGPEIGAIEEFGKSSEGSQMLGARSYNAVEAAQMFTMPAPMIEAAVAGGSLTYQNIPDLYDSFARRCLSPNYAEPIEQTLSDLLTRQIVSRFNMEALLRVDLKSRWEVYAIASTVIGQEEAAAIARRKEGIEPGDVEFAPVPQAVPQAIPASLPIQGRSAQTGPVRCEKCNKARFVVESIDPPRLQCVNCKAITSPVVQTRVEVPDPLAPMTAAIAALAERPIPTPQVTFTEGAFRAGDVHVTTPEIRVESPVTVQPADVRIEEGAFRSGDVHVAAPEAPVTNVAEGAFRLVESTPTMTVIDFDEAGEITGWHGEKAS